MYEWVISSLIISYNIRPTNIINSLELKFIQCNFCRNKDYVGSSVMG